jgi:hypothetical protein
MSIVNPTNENLYDRVVAVEAALAEVRGQLARRPPDTARSSTEVQRALETSWQPDADTFLLPHSVEDPSIGMLPMCYVHKTADQAINNNANTSVTYTVGYPDEARGDPFNMHDPAVNPSRVACRRPGWYYALAEITWGVNATGTRITEIRKNFANDASGWRSSSVFGGSANPTQQCGGWFQLAVGDYLEVVVWQDSGGALDVIGASNVPARSKFVVSWMHHDVPSITRSA